MKQEIFLKIRKTEAKRRKGRRQEKGKISPQLFHSPRTKKPLIMRHLPPLPSQSEKPTSAKKQTQK